MAKELYNNDMNNLFGGNQCAENVMGINGLVACAGAQRENNPEGIFFTKNGIYLSQWEVMDLLKNKATRDLDPKSEGFIEPYIYAYNESQSGKFLK